MIGRIVSWFWRRRGKKIPKEKRATCIMCKGSVVPGHFVGETENGGLVHAGFFRSADTGEVDFCESGAIGVGFWDGEKVVSIGPSLAQQVMETGKPMVGTIGPDGLETRVLE